MPLFNFPSTTFDVVTSQTIWRKVLQLFLSAHNIVTVVDESFMDFDQISKLSSDKSQWRAEHLYWLAVYVGQEKQITITLPDEVDPKARWEFENMQPTPAERLELIEPVIDFLSTSGENSIIVPLSLLYMNIGEPTYEKSFDIDVSLDLWRKILRLFLDNNNGQALNIPENYDFNDLKIFDTVDVKISTKFQLERINWLVYYILGSRNWNAAKFPVLLPTPKWTKKTQPSMEERNNILKPIIISLNALPEVTTDIISQLRILYNEIREPLKASTVVGGPGDAPPIGGPGGGPPPPLGGPGGGPPPPIGGPGGGPPPPLGGPGSGAPPPGGPPIKKPVENKFSSTNFDSSIFSLHNVTAEEVAAIESDARVLKLSKKVDVLRKRVNLETKNELNGMSAEGLLAERHNLATLQGLICVPVLQEISRLKNITSPDREYISSITHGVSVGKAIQLVCGNLISQNELISKIDMKKNELYALSADKANEKQKLTQEIKMAEEQLKILVNDLKSDFINALREKSTTDKFTELKKTKEVMNYFIPGKDETSMSSQIEDVQTGKPIQRSLGKKLDRFDLVRESSFMNFGYVPNVTKRIFYFVLHILLRAPIVMTPEQIKYRDDMKREKKPIDPTFYASLPSEVNYVNMLSSVPSASSFENISTFPSRLDFMRSFEPCDELARITQEYISTNGINIFKDTNNYSTYATGFTFLSDSSTTPVSWLPFSIYIEAMVMSLTSSDIDTVIGADSGSVASAVVVNVESTASDLTTWLAIADNGIDELKSVFNTVKTNPKQFNYFWTALNTKQQRVLLDNIPTDVDFLHLVNTYNYKFLKPQPGVLNEPAEVLRGYYSNNSLNNSVFDFEIPIISAAKSTPAQKLENFKTSYLALSPAEKYYVYTNLNPLRAKNLLNTFSAEDKEKELHMRIGFLDIRRHKIKKDLNNIWTVANVLKTIEVKYGNLFENCVKSTAHNLWMQSVSRMVRVQYGITSLMDHNPVDILDNASKDINLIQEPDYQSIGIYENIYRNVTYQTGVVSGIMTSSDQQLSVLYKRNVIHVYDEMYRLFGLVKPNDNAQISAQRTYLRNEMTYCKNIIRTYLDIDLLPQLENIFISLVNISKSVEESIMKFSNVFANQNMANNVRARGGAKFILAEQKAIAAGTPQSSTAPPAISMGASLKEIRTAFNDYRRYNEALLTSVVKENITDSYTLLTAANLSWLNDTQKHNVENLIPMTNEFFSSHLGTDTQPKWTVLADRPLLALQHYQKDCALITSVAKVPNTEIYNLIKETIKYTGDGEPSEADLEKIEIDINTVFEAFKSEYALNKWPRVTLVESTRIKHLIFDMYIKYNTMKDVELDKLAAHVATVQKANPKSVDVAMGSISSCKAPLDTIKTDVAASARVDIISAERAAYDGVKFFEIFALYGRPTIERYIKQVRDELKFEVPEVYSIAYTRWREYVIKQISSQIPSYWASVPADELVPDFIKKWDKNEGFTYPPLSDAVYFKSDALFFSQSSVDIDKTQNQSMIELRAKIFALEKLQGGGISTDDLNALYERIAVLETDKSTIAGLKQQIADLLSTDAGQMTLKLQSDITQLQDELTILTSSCESSTSTAVAAAQAQCGLEKSNLQTILNDIKLELKQCESSDVVDIADVQKINELNTLVATLEAQLVTLSTTQTELADYKDMLKLKEEALAIANTQLAAMPINESLLTVGQLALFKKLLILNGDTVIFNSLDDIEASMQTCWDTIHENDNPNFVKNCVADMIKNGATRDAILIVAGSISDTDKRLQLENFAKNVPNIVQLRDMESRFRKGNPAEKTAILEILTNLKMKSFDPNTELFIETLGVQGSKNVTAVLSKTSLPAIRVEIDNLIKSFKNILLGTSPNSSAADQGLATRIQKYSSVVGQKVETAKSMLEDSEQIIKDSMYFKILLGGLSVAAANSALRIWRQCNGQACDKDSLRSAFIELVKDVDLNILNRSSCKYNDTTIEVFDLISTDIVLSRAGDTTVHVRRLMDTKCGKVVRSHGGESMSSQDSIIGFV